jgi:hypothetical protein
MTKKFALLETIKFLRLKLIVILAVFEVLLAYYLYSANTITEPTAWWMLIFGVALLAAAGMLCSAIYKCIKQL